MNNREPIVPYLDDEEKELIEAYKATEFVPMKSQAEERRIAVAASKRYTGASAPGGPS